VLFSELRGLFDSHQDLIMKLIYYLCFRPSNSLLMDVKCSERLSV